jgi:hypothetical protein
MRQIFYCIALALVFTTHADAQGKKSWVGGITYQDATISCDLPNDQQFKNIGSKKDGAGMCVFTSIEMAARYQGLEQMRGWRDWAAANYAGGGYPQKVDQLLSAWWKAKSIKPIPYLQFEGKDPETIMATIDRTNRMASITYGYSPRYGRGIAHMVNAILYGDKYGTVLDNNFIGDDKYEWMDKAELVRRMRLTPNGQAGSAWVFVWLTPGSPPPPKGR